jgi:hypothetical protein
MREAVEVVCRKCGQVNRRLLPATPLNRGLQDDEEEVCFACGTPYDGGEARWIHRAGGAMGHFWYFTTMPIFFGGVGAVCALIVFSPLRLFVAQGSVVLEGLNWAGAFVGAIYGFHKARQSHRRGEMMFRRKVPRTPPAQESSDQQHQ